VIDRDGAIDSQANPAKSGSIVTFYATGWQSNFSPLADGQVATVARDACLGTCQAVASTFPAPFTNRYVLPATVLYGGAAPGIVAGVTQLNVQLGAFSALGAYSFGLAVTGPAVTGPSFGLAVWVTP
jgi:uncharacterized protein (TIGR03437 family)